MSVELERIEARLNEIVRWQASHDESHKLIGRDVAELREELYGGSGAGMKARLQAQEMVCVANREGHRKWWQEILVGAMQAVLGNAILLFVGWLLFVYARTRSGP